MNAFRRIGEGGFGGAVARVADPADATDPLDVAIDRAASTLRSEQAPDGYWCYELEADATIPAEYVLMMHYMGEVDTGLEAKIGHYLRARQDDSGGWPLYPGGDLDVSCTVKVYFALKLIGDDPQAPHMERAREAVLARGGAVKANVFTHITLALFGEIPWRGVPFIPVEIMLLPAWFPFHIRKVSYWSRTVMVPLFVLSTLKVTAANPRGTTVRELFTTDPEREREYFSFRSPLNRLFFVLDRCGRALEPFVPRFVRRRALARAESFVAERLNGDHGLGGIFPAMVNALEMFKALGYPADHPHRLQCKRALERFLVEREYEAYCQPCRSPSWDTGLASLALQEAAGDAADPGVLRGLDWLRERQLLDEPGDWRWGRPGLRGGGWAFEFRNDHYPDIDDTPVIAWAMHRSGEPRYAEAIERAAEWILGMQSSNGGWASFDIDNTRAYLNEIPFADHGALLDPPTADVTARCITFLARLEGDRFADAVDAGIAYLRAEQEADGSWFGRWGTNYVYGTWSVLTALARVLDPADPAIRRAAGWLLARQREDGGWGEDNFTYFEPAMAGTGPQSTAFQTAWALLGLIEVGEGGGEAMRHGVRFLLDRQEPDGMWHDVEFTAPGFPRVFYLKYHGYTRYFPLWALARYRRIRASS